jgi:nucleoside-diphosphate-sugar epimerase
MILTIGGSGFVGSFLIKELHNYKVGNLDKNPSPFFDNITWIC